MHVCKYVVSIELNDVTVRFGRVVALRDLSLTFDEGNGYAVMGPNGAGKTTLLRAIVGLVRPLKGEVNVLGRRAGTVHAKSQIAYLPERSGLYERLTALENLLFHARIRGMEPDKAVAGAVLLLERFALGGFAREQVYKFSKGMKQKLALARIFLGEERVLLLDEPTSGLDTDGETVLLDLLKERISNGATVLVSSHNPRFSRLLCSRGVFLREGRVARSGSLRDLLGYYRAVRIKVVLSDGLGRESLGNALKGVSYTLYPSDGEATLRAEAFSAGEIAKIVRMLVQAGVDVTEVEPEVATDETNSG
jgi:ABC-2 type transport system ATP-binding protein